MKHAAVLFAALALMSFVAVPAAASDQASANASQTTSTSATGDADALARARQDARMQATSAGMPITFPATAAVAHDYKVGPNDLLDVEVLDIDSLKRTVRVNAAGAISLPLIGAVDVAGLTSQEVEERVADRYREKYLQNPQVSVFIKEFTSQRITVEGAVARPGIFPLSGEMTLLRALALAGGFGPIANPQAVMLFRNNEQHTPVMKTYDVDQIRAGKSDDPLIRGDDLIVVQQDKTRKIFKDSLLRDIVDSVNPFSIFMRP